MEQVIIIIMMMMTMAMIRMHMPIGLFQKSALLGSASIITSSQEKFFN